jgi:hypothetical protein
MKIVWKNSLQPLSYTKDILVLKTGSTLQTHPSQMKLTQIRIDNNMGTFVTGRSYPTPDVDFGPQYDAFGRMTRSTTVNSATPAAGVDFGYVYDADGNITSQPYYHRNQQTPPTNGFTYDTLKRRKQGTVTNFYNCTIRVMRPLYVIVDEIKMYQRCLHPTAYS